MQNSTDEVDRHCGPPKNGCAAVLSQCSPIMKANLPGSGRINHKSLMTAASSRKAELKCCGTEIAYKSYSGKSAVC